MSHHGQPSIDQSITELTDPPCDNILCPRGGWVLAVRLRTCLSGSTETLWIHGRLNVSCLLLFFYIFI